MIEWTKYSKNQPSIELIVNKMIKQMAEKVELFEEYFLAHLH